MKASMPAEWEPQARCWMAWPARAAVWGEGLAAARSAYAEVARAIVRFEPVTMIADPAHAAEAERFCGAGMEILALPIDDSWIRDNGPCFVVGEDGRVSGVDWKWNAWGGLYPDHERDAAAAREILAHIGMRRIDGPLVLEGGSIMVDGEGTLITTEECLLNPNRNPGRSRDEIEAVLADRLGIERFIWLGGGLVEDETDGHVDNLVCFAAPGRVVAMTTADESDANHPILAEAVRRLKATRDARGRPLEVIEVPQPTARRVAGRRLPLSYVNLTPVNGGVIVPVFDDPADARALAVLREAFPDREVVPVPAAAICRGGGGIHCITLQQPAGPAAPPPRPSLKGEGDRSLAMSHSRIAGSRCNGCIRC